VAYSDAPECLAREASLAATGLDRHVGIRETGQPTCPHDARRLLDAEVIIEVDPSSKFLQQAGLRAAGAR
jgi:hypothetical protein